MKTTKFTLLLFLASFTGRLFSQEVSTLINDPSRSFEAIHWHPDGRIYSVDYNNGRLYQIRFDGTVETLLDEFNNLAGGGFDSNGNFYFSNIFSGDIHRLNEDGTYATITGGFNQPVGILQSAAPDTLYVVAYGSNSVSKVSITGGTVTPWVSQNGLSGPDGILFHESGDVLVANYNNNKIHRVALDGTISLFATLPASGIMGYITRGGEYIYVPSIAGNRIYRIDMEGNIALFAGTGSAGHGDGPVTEATFTNPNGITSNAAGDTILVADGNHIRMITEMETVSSLRTESIFETFQIFPNPVEDVLNVQLSLRENGALEYEIIDVRGVVQDRSKIDNVPSQPYLLQINTDTLLKGNYILRWIDEAGREQSMHFLKQ